MPEDRSGVRAGLLQEIISRGERYPQILSAMGCPILRKIRRCLKREVGIGNQFSEREQGSAVSCRAEPERSTQIDHFGATRP